MAQAIFEEGKVYWMHNICCSVPIGYKVIRRTAKMVTLVGVDNHTLEEDDEEPMRYRINGVNDFESVEVRDFSEGKWTLYAENTTPYHYVPDFSALKG